MITQVNIICTLEVYQNISEKINRVKVVCMTFHLTIVKLKKQEIVKTHQYLMV